MSLLAFLPVVIGLVVLLAAYVIYSISLEVLEEDQHFWAAIGGFFVIYILAAIGMYFLVAHPQGATSISDAIRAYFSIIPSSIERPGTIK
jgi:uncharacterized membrane protein YqjE